MKEGAYRERLSQSLAWRREGNALLTEALRSVDPDRQVREFSNEPLYICMSNCNPDTCQAEILDRRMNNSQRYLPCQALIEIHLPLISSSLIFASSNNAVSCLDLPGNRMRFKESFQ